MVINPVISLLGRRLCLGVVGWGLGSFIGAMHRESAQLDDRYAIVTGVLSSEPKKSNRTAAELGMDPDCIYSCVHEMLDAETACKDGIDAVSIMTPDDSHFDYSIAVLEHAVDVICDKPMRRAGKPADPLAMYLPNSRDGLLGVRFVHDVIESSKANGRWTWC